MFTLLVTSRFMDATTAVAVGLSLSMTLSAAHLDLLTVRSIWHAAKAAIFTVTAILKVTVLTLKREKCECDSVLETASKVSPNADAYTSWAILSRVFVEEVPRAGQ